MMSGGPKVDAKQAIVVRVLSALLCDPSFTRSQVAVVQFSLQAGMIVRGWKL